MMTRGPITVLLVADAAGRDTIEYMFSQSELPVTFSALEQLGLGNILDPSFHHRVTPHPTAQMALALQQSSTDADSVIGHREMVGIVDPHTYTLFPQGFPEEVVKEVERRTDCTFMYNQMAGGTEVILECHQEHFQTKRLILYSSVCDPLAQIAAHEDIVDPTWLGKVADTFFAVARECGVNITRVISRPYEGDWEQGFVRTSRRHDAVIALPGKTLVEVLREEGVWVAGVGKFPEMVPAGYDQTWKLTKQEEVGTEWTWTNKGDTNHYSFEGAKRAIEAAKTEGRRQGAVVLVNCVDTDAVYGHSLNHEGWLTACQALDVNLAELMTHLETRDAFLFTADHGMQRRNRLDKPGAVYGYHNRESVPFLGMQVEGRLQFAGDESSFTSVGATIAHLYNVEQRYNQEVLARNSTV